LRPTIDIDLIVEKSESNLENIKKAIMDIVPEVNEISYKDFIKYGERGVIRIGTDLNFYIDIAVKIGDFDYEKLIKNAEYTEIEGVKIPYAGLEDMIELKSTYREQDQRDKLFLIGKKKYLEEHRD